MGKLNGRGEARPFLLYVKFCDFPEARVPASCYGLYEHPVAGDNYLLIGGVSAQYPEGAALDGGGGLPCHFLSIGVRTVKAPVFFVCFFRRLVAFVDVVFIGQPFVQIRLDRDVKRQFL